MKGPPPLEPTPCVIVGCGAPPQHEVAELTALARKAYASLDHHGKEAQDEWRRFAALIAPVAGKDYCLDDDALLRRLDPALARGGAPRFHANEVLRWITASFDPWRRPRILSVAPLLAELLCSRVASGWGLGLPCRGEPSRRATPANIASALEQTAFGRTTIWPFEESWFVVGELEGELTSLLARHCPGLVLVPPRFPSALAARLREHRNPWLRRPRWFVELSHDALAECGLRLDTAVWYWLSALLLRHDESTRQALRGEPARVGEPRIARQVSVPVEEAPNAERPIGPDLRHEVLATRAREQLSAVLARRFGLSEAEAWIIFVLRATRESDLVVLRADAQFTGWSAVAHVGAGRVVRLGCTHYPIEDAVDITMTREPVSRDRYEIHLDGGNVHVRILELDPVELLEGERSLPRAVDSGSQH